jgi:predicted ATPase
VGREAELQQLHERLDQALRGERQTIFVTGEAGIGKTTVVETFVAQLATREDLCIMQGQCVELYGAGEAYLPMLEAMEQACRTGGEQLRALLRQYAPTWLVQMPSLLSLPEREQLQRELRGITRERMLREATRTIEALTVKKALVLILEDLHWSDYSTLDLLAYLAR